MKHPNRSAMRRSGVWGNAASSPTGLGLALVAVIALSGCDANAPPSTAAPPSPPAPVPAWAEGAVFYQIFPERFRNGDPSNDPIRESLEAPSRVSEDWRVSRWGADWYARDEWETQRGDNFYRDGVYDRRYGGDLQGVIDKLAYLKSLGVDAIYLNPIFYAPSLHKYDGASFHHIDPHFGPDPAGDLAQIAAEAHHAPDEWFWTAADKLFLRLLREAHERDLRVVIDGVFNHTGRQFFAFQDLVERQQDSTYKDWYKVGAFDDPATPADELRVRGWNGHRALPELADTPRGDDLAPGPKAYVLAATRRWMDPDGDGDPADGVDGWRLDVAPEVPTPFWLEWNGLVRSINPQALTVAEQWDNAPAYLEATGFGSTMNYHGFAYPVKGYLIDGVLPPSEFARMITERWEAFPQSRRHAQWSLIDSHDTQRVASMIVNADGERPYFNPERFDYDAGERSSPRGWSEYQVRKPTERERRLQRMVALMQVTFPGAPTLYYGVEAGMWGADDPDDRMPMVWGDLAYDDQAADPLGRPREPDPVGVDDELWRFYQSACWLRSQITALRGGDYEVVTADDRRNLFAFKRTQGDVTAFVFFNRSEDTHEIDTELPAGGAIHEAFTASGQSDRVEVRSEGSRLKVRLPGLDAVVVLSRPGEPGGADK
ncbi:Neopullulanase 2 [Pseudobythopirellula maris]|uniref:Neopullulanase 2 n=1 Tax=Pseudobythopirellula maris TaxID=2527991 RepID=A0A5C5ZHQ1_9BACT|nr:glycoside hydrolase family 13 protein [Pseudobythopirellula maris]TWT86650.1 Neopullulanase 2 [Pseudobythopirellula maris]